MKHEENLLVMLIKFYNMQAGTAFRSSNENNKSIVDGALTCINDDVSSLKNHIRTFCKENMDCNTSDGFNRCFESVVKVEVEEVEAVVPARAHASAPSENAVASSLGILEQAVVKMVADMQADKIESAVMGSVEDKVRAFIKNEYGTIERKINTVIDGVPSKVEGVVHDKFDTVVKFVANNEPVMLVGPAGSGKNELCKQVADALGLDFYFTNAVTQEYKLTGFTDANGKFHETQFYKAFTEGGLFMLDEMDASIPEVLVILNAAIANGYFDFPAPIGFKKAHENFRVIAAGNTWGHGADYEYVGRNQLDGASLDRFAVIEIDYSKAIEDAVCMGNLEVADFCRDFRKNAMKCGLNVIVSYRAMKRLAKMVQLLDLEEALDTCLVKGLEKDDLKVLIPKMNRNKYVDALEKISERKVA